VLFKLYDFHQPFEGNRFLQKKPKFEHLGGQKKSHEYFWDVILVEGPDLRCPLFGIKIGSVLSELEIMSFIFEFLKNQN
jgi:hypothetical protein